MNPSEELPPLEDKTIVESINKADLKPMYDTNHEHIYAPDETDVTGKYYAVTCTVDNCNVGKLMRR